MEIDVTVMLHEDCSRISGSVAELGENAGKITWGNAVKLSEARDYMFVNDTTRQAIRDHFAEYGAWDRSEINGWSDTDLNAIFLQDVASEVRQFEDLADSDWSEWVRLCEAGTVSGRLFGSDDGKAYYYVGM